MKYLGIDHGGKRIGLAIGDDETRVASPLEVVEADSNEEAVAAIGLIIKEEGIDKIILGLPLSLKGEEGAQAARVREFGNGLSKLSKIDVIYEDERLSSKMADALLKEALPEKRDAVAAMVILQSYLDKLRKV
ncbi:Holliday junction resolvase RuvX [Candidatus Uhrbacteria bacterium]|nr:Holliday junction resolvase RuvX [Candidatus Uhrbacteria bacterium]